jgi:hypothetical protein
MTTKESFKRLIASKGNKNFSRDRNERLEKLIEKFLEDKKDEKCRMILHDQTGFSQ